MKSKYSISKEAFVIAGYAIEAMLCEVAAYPSPGLVSSVSKGAHVDMDYYTFIKSTSILSKYMVLFAEQGFSNNSPKDIFIAIRTIGIEAEIEMFKGTEGINTHKGLIFLLGISCAAVAKAINDKKSFGDIQGIIKDMTKGIVQDELTYMCKEKAISHGEKLFLKHNVEGIRGEVERGIPLVFDYSLGIFKENKHLKFNDRLIHTLLCIMMYCEDSNILHRQSMDTLKKVQEKATEIINLGGMATKVGQAKIEDLDIEFIKGDISPGGSADLLAVTMFFSSIDIYMKN